MKPTRIVRYMGRVLSVAGVTLVLLVAACAVGDRSRMVPSGSGRPQEAEAFFTALDRLVAQHGVRDAHRSAVPGFPYLRTDRFLAAMKNRLETAGQRRFWLESMRLADLSSRRNEIANLPEAALRQLGVQGSAAPGAGDVLAAAERYSLEMMTADQRLDGFTERVARVTKVPDVYATAMRAFLLYPLAALPVSIGTERAYDKYRGWHATPPEELPVSGRLVRFAPREDAVGYSRGDLERLFAAAGRDPFGLPQWTHRELLSLAEMFAPVFIQDVAADYDRFGAVAWNRGRVSIEPSRPAVYYYRTHAFLNETPVVQLNYAIWYSARAGKNAPAIERGPLDGMTLRYTFDEHGAVVMADVMNNCGCYHFFVPSHERVAAVIKRDNDFAPLIPAWLPEAVPRRRMALRINSGWHQAQHVGTDSAQAAPPVFYTLLPYERLECLPDEGGRNASVFNPKGIMKDSWRVEPYIFFSMGIPKVGYMRQRGHHAIKMVGREHFTNPYLFDRNFTFTRE